MQKFFVTVTLLTMCLIIVLIIAPLLVNLKGYKTALTDTIQTSTGLEVKINGDVRVTFFPSPSVVVTDIYVENMEGAASSRFLHVEVLKVKASLLKLLSNKVDIQEITLVRPTAELEQFSDGRQNWKIVKDALQRRDSAKLKSVSLPDSVKIQGGTISYRTREERTNIDDITATVKMASVMGPFDIDGNFISREKAVKYVAHVDALKENSDATLKIFSDSFELNLTGNYKSADSSIAGEMEGKVTNLSEFFRTFYAKDTLISRVTSKEEVALKGAFSIQKDQMHFSGLTLDAPSIKGKSDFEISVASNTQRDEVQWEMTAQLEEMNLDTLFASVETPEGGGLRYVAATEGFTWSDYKFTMPTDVSALLDITIKNVKVKGQSIENIVLNVDVFEGKAMIHKAMAKLPGDAEFSLNGNIEHNGTRPLLNGKVTVSGHALRDELVWLFPGMAFIPEKQLGEFMLTGNVQMTPLKINLSDAHLSVDRTLFSGEVSIRPAVAVPVVDINLAVERMDLDQYGISHQLVDALKKLTQTEAGRKGGRMWIGRLNAKINTVLDISNVVFNGYTLDKLTVNASVLRDEFVIQRLQLSSDVSDATAGFQLNFKKEKPVMNVWVASKGFDTALFNFDKDTVEESKPLQPDKNGWIWPNTPFNFIGLKDYNGTVKAVFRHFRHKDLLLSDVELEAKMGDTIFQITKAKSALYDGKMELAGGFSLDEQNPHFQMQVLAQDVSASPLIQMFDPGNMTQGAVSFSGGLRSAGKTPVEWVKNLVITDGKIQGKDMVFNRFDLDHIVSKMASTYSAIDMKEVVKQAMAEGNSVIETMQGKVSTQGGILEVRDVLLMNYYSRGKFSGNINLANLDIKALSRFSFQPEQGTAVTLDVGFDGNLLELKRSINTENLEQYITDKGALKKDKKKAGQ